MSNEKAKILSPVTDIIFKLLMGTESSKEILTDFLFAVLDLSPDEYDEIKYKTHFFCKNTRATNLAY